MANLEEIKPTIRAILMALGNRATEREFRGEFFNQEGQSFNVVLKDFGMTFFEFMRNLSDVCRAYMLGDEVLIEKVSDASSRHMDNLTVVKKKKVPSRFSYRTSGYVPFKSTFSTSGRPLARHVMPQQTSHFKKFAPPVRTFMPLTVNKPAAKGPFLPSNKPNLALKTPVVPPKQSYEQYKKEKAKLSALPPAPHMLAKAIVYSTLEGSHTDDEKSSFEKPKKSLGNEETVQISNPRIVSLENNENIMITFHNPSDDTKVNGPPLGKVSKEDKENKKMVPSSDDYKSSDPRGHGTNLGNQRAPMLQTSAFLAALNDIKNQRGADIYKQRPQVPSAHLPDTGKKVITISENEQSRLVKPKIPRQAPKYQPVTAQMEVKSKELLATVSKSQAEEKVKSLEAEIELRKKEIQILQEAMAASKVTRTKSLTKVKKLEALLKVVVPFPKVTQLNGTKNFMVSLVEINSPSQFSFQFNHKELLNLTKEMNLFYDNQNGALKVPRNALSAGQFVALLDGKNWRRVEIICISEGDVLVHAIDWGWKRYVKIADLSYLTEEFAISTRKACKGCLHGVKPIEALWNPSAIMAFMTKTKGQKILATVKAAADNTFELSLTYNAMLNSTVEDYLLERKLAKVSDEIKPTMNGVLIY